MTTLRFFLFSQMLNGGGKTGKNAYACRRAPEKKDFSSCCEIISF
jgi:hypothetical protein